MDSEVEGLIALAIMGWLKSYGAHSRGVHEEWPMQVCTWPVQRVVVVTVNSRFFRLAVAALLLPELDTVTATT